MDHETIKRDFARAHLKAFEESRPRRIWNSKRVLDLAYHKLEARIQTLLAAGFHLSSGAGALRVEPIHRGISVSLNVPAPLSPRPHWWIEANCTLPSGLNKAAAALRLLWVGEDRYVEGLVARMLAQIARLEGEHCRRQGVAPPPSLRALQEKIKLEATPGPIGMEAAPAARRL